MNTNSLYTNNKLPPKIKIPDFVSQMNDIEIKCRSYDSSDKILTVDTLVDITFVNVDIIQMRFRIAIKSDERF